MKRITCAVFTAGIIMAGAGCSGVTAAPEPAATVTVTQQSSAAPSNSTAPNAGGPASAEPVSTPAQPLVVLPNVVGKNHQLAQDLMQAKGLFNLREEDATGAQRLLVLDRNWVVVRQSPKAGRQVPADAVVTLYSKKIGE